MTGVISFFLSSYPLSRKPYIHTYLTYIHGARYVSPGTQLKISPFFDLLLLLFLMMMLAKMTIPALGDEEEEEEGPEKGKEKARN